MAANPLISMSAAQTMADALTALLNTGFIQVYSAPTTIPATLETAITDQVLLAADIALSATAFGASTDNGDGTAKATANAITSDTDADATGTAAFFRGFASNHTTAVIQGTCGTSAADMILNTTSIRQHGTVAVTSWTIQMPDGTGSD